VVFVEDIPKSRAGKILRGVLKERAASMGEAKKAKL
jgi:acyl-coenzyme A synthetase/AMP-(fatty) acid ligase